MLSASVNLATNRAFVTYDATEATTDDLCATVEHRRLLGVEARTRRRCAPARATPITGALRAAVSWPTALAGAGGGALRPQDAVSGWIVLGLAVVVEVAGGWPFLRASARLLRHGATSMDTLIAVGHAGRAGRQRGGGHRPRRPARPPRRGRRVRGAPARRHGAAHRRHPRHGPGGRGAGPGPGRAGHALLDGPAAPDRPGGVGPRGRRRPPGRPRERAGGRVGAGPPQRGHSPRRNRRRAGGRRWTSRCSPASRCPSTTAPAATSPGGTRNGAGALVVRVATIAAESVLARMQRLVEDAQRDKPPTQKLADRISGVFVPVVLVAAARHVPGLVAAGRELRDGRAERGGGAAGGLPVRHGPGDARWP